MSRTLPSLTEPFSQPPITRTPLLWLTLPVICLLMSLSLSLSACGSQQAGSSRAPVATNTSTTVVENPTLTPTDPAAQTWIPLSGQSSAAILAAVRQSPFFQMVTNAPPNSDGYTDLSHLGSPVFVMGFGTNKEGGSVNAPDFYEIPALSSAGLVENVVSAQLNSSHTAISVGSVSSVAPAPQWPGQLVTSSKAVQIVQAQRQTNLRSGTHAQLIYLAAYNTSAIETGQLTWNAGGGGPMNPIWLVPGANGQDYFVGTDAHSYTVAELPLQ